MTMIDGKKAKEIATKFLEQYNTVTDTKVVLKGNTWTVVVASGFENKKLKQVKIDAETGKILGYIPIN